MKNKGLMSPEDEAAKAAHEVWQEEFEEEMRFKEELRKEGAKHEQERIAFKLKKNLPEIAKILLDKSGNEEQTISEEIFTINGIDINKLVTDLEKLNFFDSCYKKDILDWFSGIRLLDPIPINGSATRFISLIADLMDKRPKFIKNSKEFVYKYIQTSFLFNGKQAKHSMIKQIMKPGSNKNRVSYHTKTIPNILDYRN